MLPPIEIADPALLQEILGYLNFSSGSSDPTFLRRLNELWQAIENTEPPQGEVCAIALQLLHEKLTKLTGSSAAFQNVDQAEHVLRLIFDEVLPAYRRHHRDLLFHQSDAQLWQPFFIGRVAEAVLTSGGPWNETERIVEESLRRLNDFLGYRPIPVLETHKHEPYAHERVRPLPLYIAGAGVGTGKYRELIEQTLHVLQHTDADVLEAAGFDFAALDELGFDPRAYDFNHPVNRRPNYHFGTWDPHLIDNKGRYRAIRHSAVHTRCRHGTHQASSRFARGASVVGSGRSFGGHDFDGLGHDGSGPEAYDSSVSLATLYRKLPRIEMSFINSCLLACRKRTRQRLETEAASRRQLFAGARQHLNAELARRRACNCSMCDWR